MKILLLNQTFYPDSMATSQQVTDLARYLVDEGHAVTVVTDRADYDQRKSVYQPYEVYEGVEIHRVGSTRFGKRSFLHRMIDGITFNASALFKVMQLPRQDMVVSFTSPPLIGVLGAAYSTLSRAHSVQWLMDVNPDAAIAVGYLREGGFPARFLTGLLDFTLRHSSRVVVLDRWMRERIIGHGARPESIAIIPPWPLHDVPDEPRPRRGETELRREHGLTGKFVVMYSGNHSIVHPLDTLLEAAVRLKDDADIRFVFIGGGLRSRDVAACVEKHGLTNVTQLPYQRRERLEDSLASADLHVVVMGDRVSGLVHTSKLYGVMLSGAPYVFIGPKRSHVSDVLGACPCGFQVEHGDVAGLVARIRAARALTPGERARFAKENGRFVATHYARPISLEAFSRQVLRPLEPGATATPSAPLARGSDSRPESRRSGPAPRRARTGRRGASSA